MTALAANSTTIVARDMPWSTMTEYEVLTNVVCYQGAIIVIDAATGYAKPGITAVGDAAIGRCRVLADNTGGASGAIRVQVDSGVFGPYTNIDSIDITDLTQLCYITDDQSVSQADVSQSEAGIIWEVTSAGVFVAFAYPAARTGV